MSFEHWEVSQKGGVAYLTLNRPDVHNALDDQTVKEGLAALDQAQENRDVRVIVIGGNGKSFCAGADLNYMKRVQEFSKQENIKDAEILCELFYRIYTCDKPVVARVHGAARGGGTGLLAACDLVIAASRATFAFTEVKLGLVPAVISPYLMRRVPEGSCRYYIITGRKFDAAEAHRLGLVDVVVEDDSLDQALTDHLDELGANGPQAMASAKELIRTVSRSSPEEARVFTSRMLARIRREPEAQEGFSAFLEKRKPGWAKQED